MYQHTIPVVLTSQHYWQYTIGSYYQGASTIVTQVSFPTALGPNDPDDGITGRQQRGLAIAAIAPIQKNRLGYQVPSQSGNGSYVVSLDDEPFCTCPDFDKRQEPCKHVFAVEFTVQREVEAQDRTTNESETVQVALGPSWTAYNLAQTNEQELFGTLLRELCATIPQPPQGKGRPRLPISDILFALGLKVYSTMSGRRAMTDFRNAHASGLLSTCPSFSTAFRYMEDRALTPVLKHLIEQSALPLKAVETDFTADASGFSTSVYDRWFDHKWGKEKKQARFLKAHIMCGVNTKIVTAVEITEANVHDSPPFPGLVAKTAEAFTMTEVPADKAYLSRKNLRAIVDAGATPYIPFKVNSRPEHTHGDSLWAKTYHYFSLHREEFMAHYHKRSNVETAFHMVKAKFGGALRSKNPEAQVNEALVKILCHNLCVLIQAMYALSLQPDFGTERTFASKTPVDAKVN